MAVKLLKSIKKYDGGVRKSHELLESYSQECDKNGVVLKQTTVQYSGGEMKTQTLVFEHKPTETTPNCYVAVKDTGESVTMVYDSQYRLIFKYESVGEKVKNQFNTVYDENGTVRSKGSRKGSKECTQFFDADGLLLESIVSSKNCETITKYEYVWGYIDDCVATVTCLASKTKCPKDGQPEFIEKKVVSVQQFDSLGRTKAVVTYSANGESCRRKYSYLSDKYEEEYTDPDTHALICKTYNVNGQLLTIHEDDWVCMKYEYYDDIDGYNDVEPDESESTLFHNFTSQTAYSAFLEKRDVRVVSGSTNPTNAKTAPKSKFLKDYFSAKYLDNKMYNAKAASFKQLEDYNSRTKLISVAKVLCPPRADATSLEDHLLRSEHQLFANADSMTTHEFDMKLTEAVGVYVSFYGLQFYPSNINRRMWNYWKTAVDDCRAGTLMNPSEYSLNSSARGIETVDEYVANKTSSQSPVQTVLSLCQSMDEVSLRQVKYGVDNLINRGRENSEFKPICREDLESAFSVLSTLLIQADICGVCEHPNHFSFNHLTSVSEDACSSMQDIANIVNSALDSILSFVLAKNETGAGEVFEIAREFSIADEVTRLPEEYLEKVENDVEDPNARYEYELAKENVMRKFEALESRGIIRGLNAMLPSVGEDNLQKVANDNSFLLGDNGAVRDFCCQVAFMEIPIYQPMFDKTIGVSDHSRTRFKDCIGSLEVFSAEEEVDWKVFDDGCQKILKEFYPDSFNNSVDELFTVQLAKYFVSAFESILNVKVEVAPETVSSAWLSFKVTGDFDGVSHSWVVTPVADETDMNILKCIAIRMALVQLAHSWAFFGVLAVAFENNYSISIIRLKDALTGGHTLGIEKYEREFYDEVFDQTEVVSEDEKREELMMANRLSVPEEEKFRWDLEKFLEACNVLFELSSDNKVCWDFIEKFCENNSKALKSKGYTSWDELRQAILFEYRTTSVGDMTPCEAVRIMTSLLMPE